MVHHVRGVDYGLVTVDDDGMVADYEPTDGAPAADPPVEWEIGMPFLGFAQSRVMFRFDPVEE
jgi:hypothetical protein